MCKRRTLAGLKQAASVFLFVLMVIGLMLKSWIMTDQTHWGLFRWCYNDEYYDVIKSDGKNSSNSSFSDQCHQIRPGDSPTYMEVVRTLSVVSALLIYFSMFFTINAVKMDTPSCCFTKMVFSSMPSLTAGLLLVVLALHYKEDERWRDLNPSLGLSFWFVLTVAILNLSLSCCLCYLWGRENRRRNLYGVDDFCCLCLGENRRRNLERGDRPYLPSRRLSTVSRLSITSKKKMTIFWTERSACRGSGGVEPPAVVNPLAHHPGQVELSETHF